MHINSRFGSKTLKFLKKTVRMMSEYNRTHMAGENLRKSNQEVGNLRFVAFPTLGLSQCLWGQIALPKASTRCLTVFRTLFDAYTVNEGGMGAE
jgi:hypothetical protein